MGSQLFKNYDVEKEPTCIGGQNGLWSINNAVKQDSTKKKASIWSFDKSKVNDKNAKNNKDEIAAFLKKEAQQLLKFRHPNIVNLVEPLIEDKQVMAFVTDRVDDNLYNLIKKGNYQAICSSQLELKLQIENILKVLQFLHNDLKMAHVGICPENIFIVNGQWKLAGFTFSTQINQATNEVQNADLKKRPFESYCQFYPNLSFSAPEITEDTPKCTFSSDIFSLGLLILYMYQIKHAQSTNVTPLLNSKTKAEYEQALGSISQSFKNSPYINELSDDVKKLLAKMLARNPQQRPTIEQIRESNWLKDPFVKAIYMLETIYEFDQNKQTSFITNLLNILFKFEHSVIKKRIVPQLLDLQKFEYLIPVILNVIIECLKQENLYSQAEYNSEINSFILELTKRKSIPGKALYLLVMNCELFMKYIEKNDFQNIYLAPVLKCFDIPQLQQYALTQTEFLVTKLDYQFTKSKLLPRILNLCVSKNQKIMKQSILILKKIIPNLDKHTLNEQVLSTLDKLRKVPVNDKQLTMIILEIYQIIAKSLDINVIAEKILPSLIPQLIDQSLGRQEFDSYLGAVNAMIRQIEEERHKQINDNQQRNEPQQINFGEENNNANNNNNNENNGGGDGFDDLFNQIENKPKQDNQGKEFDFLFSDSPKNKNQQNNNNNEQSLKQQSLSQTNLPQVQAKQISQSTSQAQVKSPIQQAQNNNNNNNKQKQQDMNFDMFESDKQKNNNDNFFNNFNSNQNKQYQDPFQSMPQKDPFQSMPQKDPFQSMPQKDPFAQKKQQVDIDELFGDTNQNNEKQKQMNNNQNKQQNFMGGQQQMPKQQQQQEKVQKNDDFDLFEDPKPVNIRPPSNQNINMMNNNPNSNFNSNSNNNNNNNNNNRKQNDLFSNLKTNKPPNQQSQQPFQSNNNKNTNPQSNDLLSGFNPNMQFNMQPSSKIEWPDVGDPFSNNVQPSFPNNALNNNTKKVNNNINIDDLFGPPQPSNNNNNNFMNQNFNNNKVNNDQLTNNNNQNKAKQNNNVNFDDLFG